MSLYHALAHKTFAFLRAARIELTIPRYCSTVYHTVEAYKYRASIHFLTIIFLAALAYLKVFLKTIATFAITFLTSLLRYLTCSLNRSLLSICTPRYFITFWGVIACPPTFNDSTDLPTFGVTVTSVPPEDWLPLTGVYSSITHAIVALSSFFSRSLSFSCLEEPS